MFDAAFASRPWRESFETIRRSLAELIALPDRLVPAEIKMARLNKVRPASDDNRVMTFQNRSYSSAGLDIAIGTRNGPSGQVELSTQDLITTAFRL